MCVNKKSTDHHREIRNAKAHYNYFVGDRIDAGLVLLGAEVKAVRAGDAQISESFCRIEKDQVWMHNSHIGEYKFANNQNHQSRRKRKLLLKKREIYNLIGAMEAGGKSLIPLRIYFKNGLIKLELALCTGKKLYDKRETLKKKISMREAEREMSRRHR